MKKILSLVLILVLALGVMVPAMAEAPKTIYLIVKVLGNQYWSVLQNAVSAQAAGIVIGPVDSTSLMNPIREAYESGIPVVLVDTTVNGDAYSAELMTNNVNAGKTTAEHLIQQMKDQGVNEEEEGFVAIQVGSTGSQTIIDRLRRQAEGRLWPQQRVYGGFRYGPDRSWPQGHRVCGI